MPEGSTASAKVFLELFCFWKCYTQVLEFKKIQWNPDKVNTSAP